MNLVLRLSRHSGPVLSLLLALAFPVLAEEQTLAQTTEAPKGEQVSASAAEQAPDNRSIDDKVQDLKKQVIELNRDLFVLEEELLFPAATQFTVFLSVDVGEFFRLDSVQLKIDNKVVANHLYTEREANALSRGGVQRLHMGNLTAGKHELVAVFLGLGPNGRQYRRGTELSFEKTAGNKYLELKIMDSTAKQQPEFQVKEWN